MGSLKDEMRGLREEHKSCEKDDGERPGGSDGSAAPGGPQIIKISQDPSSRGNCKPELHMNVCSDEETDKNPKSKELSGGMCDNADQSDSKGVNDRAQTASIPLIQQTEAGTHKTISGGNSGVQGETSKDKVMDHEEGKEEIKKISVPVPSTPGPSDPRSPAPAGQQHMRTQVSLEVVQCHSAATSPMTPPEGGHSFFFPSAFGRSEGVGTDTQDAELQVGQQVEFCSVATSPMTPKTPYTTAFPVLIGREKGERVKRSEGQSESGFPEGKSPAEAESEMKCITSKQRSEDFSSAASPESSSSCPAAGLTDSPVPVEESNQQGKQQRMGSMDQDITITVTHYNNNEDEEEESSFHTIELEMVKIDEYEELGGSSSGAKEDGKEHISTETVAEHARDTPQNQTEGVTVSAPEFKENKGACEEATKPPVPESPAPFGCHNIRTQVSLEVVQCQSAATSPMTPPEGDQAFYFPSSSGTCAAAGAETKDAELQVGQHVEYRSVATAPMTPRTPTTTVFPDIRKEASIEEKIEEEEEEKVVEDRGEERESKEENVAAEEDTNEARNSKDKFEEPVQEVSWDEKGMTWEVYGAVVEVTVLGSAIQKHLEKQVKKRQPSMPPPPPLNPATMPLSSEPIQGGSGKGRVGKRREQDEEVSRRRRNPFRLMMENMQQPHCCSKAHTTE